MPSPTFREVSVNRAWSLTPNMQRVELVGESLLEFPDGLDGGYIKLTFDQQGQPMDDPAALEALGWQQAKLRTYTIRRFDRARQMITVDFVLHGDHGEPGPASGWASRCQPGDRILIAGPGPARRVGSKPAWCFIAGDMTALPAISANLEQLPEDSRGYAVIEINHQDDRQALEKPAGVELIWVVKSDTENLESRVRELPWLEDGAPAVWVACEFSTMRRLRQHFSPDRGIERRQRYVSSYWREGRSEDQHKVDKQADAKAAGEA